MTFVKHQLPSDAAVAKQDATARKNVCFKFWNDCQCVTMYSHLDGSGMRTVLYCRSEASLASAWKEVP